jgi:hypothetical protein
MPQAWRAATGRSHAAQGRCMTQVSARNMPDAALRHEVRRFGVTGKRRAFGERGNTSKNDHNELPFLEASPIATVEPDLRRGAMGQIYLGYFGREARDLRRVAAVFVRRRLERRRPFAGNREKSIVLENAVASATCCFAKRPIRSFNSAERYQKIQRFRLIAASPRISRTSNISNARRRLSASLIASC